MSGPGAPMTPAPDLATLLQDSPWRCVRTSFEAWLVTASGLPLAKLEQPEVADTLLAGANLAGAVERLVRAARAVGRVPQRWPNDEQWRVPVAELVAAAQDVGGTDERGVVGHADSQERLSGAGVNDVGRSAGRLGTQGSRKPPMSERKPPASAKPESADDSLGAPIPRTGAETAAGPAGASASLISVLDVKPGRSSVAPAQAVGGDEPPRNTVASTGGASGMSAPGGSSAQTDVGGTGEGTGASGRQGAADCNAPAGEHAVVTPTVLRRDLPRVETSGQMPGPPPVAPDVELLPAPVPSCARPGCGHVQRMHTCWGECHVERYVPDDDPGIEGCSVACHEFIAPDVVEPFPLTLQPMPAYQAPPAPPAEPALDDHAGGGAPFRGEFPQPGECPRCGGALEYDEVDIGVGTLRGNPGCPECYWTPSESQADGHAEPLTIQPCSRCGIEVPWDETTPVVCCACECPDHPTSPAPSPDHIAFDARVRLNFVTCESRIERYNGIGQLVVDALGPRPMGRSRVRVTVQKDYPLLGIWNRPWARKVSPRHFLDECGRVRP